MFDGDPKFEALADAMGEFFNKYLVSSGGASSSSDRSAHLLR